MVREIGPHRRILVVANETVGAEALRHFSGRARVGMQEDVLVVCPALNSRLEPGPRIEDHARDELRSGWRPASLRSRLRRVRATGIVGDGDPLQALEDALRTFPADEIVISTHPPVARTGSKKGVVAEAERRYDVPVTHVVSTL